MTDNLSLMTDKTAKMTDNFTLSVIICHGVLRPKKRPGTFPVCNDNDKMMVWI